MIAEIIAGIPLFAGLPPAEIERLAGTVEVCEFAENTVLFREAEADDHFYILVEGQIEVFKELGGGEERILAVRHAGDLLGEMSLFTPDRTHTASVRTLTPVRLLEIKIADFEALLSRQPQLANKMAHSLSRRLEDSENLSILELKEINRQLAQAYLELQAAQAQLIEKEKMERELEIARQIQRSILPQELPKQAGYDFGARMTPARAVGGDFFDFIPLDRQRLGIVVGDVSDKGVPAALFMTLTYSLVRAEAGRGGSPREVLQAVNHHLLGINSSGTFVTLIYGVLDYATRRLEYARAGHPLPVVVDSEGREVVLPYSTGQLLGLLEEPLLDVQSLTLPPGAVVLFYSDGFTESASPQGQEFGLECLREVVAKQGNAGAQALCDRLNQAIEAYTAGQPQQDDLTSLVIRVL